MNRHKCLLAICLVVVAFGVLVSTKQLSSNTKNHQNVGALTQNLAANVPEFVPYMFLFAHHGYNLKKAAELEQQGKDGTRFRTMFKKRAALSDEESAILDRVTSDCEQELAQQDAKAQNIIDEYRKNYPLGLIPAGTTLSPPPPELTTLQEERNAIILRARDRLHAELGEAEFARFHAFVQSLHVSSKQPAN
jgi:hypothetical protein